jgi:hypothetical protein
MKPRHSLLAVLLLCGLAIGAPMSAPVRAEVDALLASLETSGCQFNRNGSWYSGAEARNHLLGKLEYLEKRGTVQSAEQFIELAASKSSVSGQAYQVRCNGQSPVASQTWLAQQLTALRGQVNKRP